MYITYIYICIYIYIYIYIYVKFILIIQGDFFKSVIFRILQILTDCYKQIYIYT